MEGGDRGHAGSNVDFSYAAVDLLISVPSLKLIVTREQKLWAMLFFQPLLSLCYGKAIKQGGRGHEKSAWGAVMLQAEPGSRLFAYFDVSSFGSNRMVWIRFCCSEDTITGIWGVKCSP